jgi:hypothetical protein
MTLLTITAFSASGHTALVVGPLSDLYRRVAADLRIGFDHMVGFRGEGDSKTCLNLGIINAKADRPPPVTAIPSMLLPLALAPNFMAEIVAAPPVLRCTPTPLDQPVVIRSIVDF